MAHFDVVLAVGGELRPVFRDRGERIEQAAVDQHQRRQRGDILGAGEDIDDRVFRPLSGLCFVGVPTPDVDDELTVDVDGDGGAEFAAADDFVGQCGNDVLEAAVVVTVQNTRREVGVDQCRAVHV